MPAVGEAHVWWADRADVRPKHVALLDAGERRRRDLLARRVHRDLFTLGCALLRTVLGTVLGVRPGAVRIDRSCPDCDRPHGRPTLRHAGGLDCSLSRSGDRVVVAVTRGARIGVDVERVVTLTGLDRLVTQVLAPAELRSWRGGPDPLGGFYSYWTRKEAILKAAGCGLRIAPVKLTLSDPGTPPRLLTTREVPLAVERVHLHELRAPAGYAACAAVVGDAAAAIVEHDARPLLTAGMAP